MKVVDLVRRDSLSLKQGESYVSESPLLGSSGGPVFCLHDAIISRRAAKGDSIPFVIGPHSCEGAAAGYSALKMVDMGRLQVRTGGLIVAAIFVQPRNREGSGGAVCGYGLLVVERVNHGRNCERKGRQSANFQDASATPGWVRRGEGKHGASSESVGATASKVAESDADWVGVKGKLQ